MKKRGHSRRLLSVLLALVMLLSLLPTAVFADTTPKATLITDASTLKAGDQIILAASANGKTYAAGSLSGKLLTSIETNPTDPADTVEIFTLGGEAGKWTLTASDGKQIYTADAKALNNTGKGTGTWTIAIDDSGLATVASTDSACGRILYNVKSPRFLNYTSATNVSMLLPSIYRLEVSPARQSGIVTDLTTLRDGDKVVVFNPANGKTLSTEYTGHYNKGTDVTLADGKLEGFTDADKWTLGINDDGTYTFATADGKKLAMGTDFTSTPLDEVNRNWKITAVDGKDATFYIDNTGRTDKYRLQWFTSKGNWSAYTGTGDAFEQQIYLVVESGSETPDPEPGPTALIKDGKYVIYNPGSGKAMSADATGTYYRAGKDVTVTNGKVTDPAEDLIWTVTSENGVYTITTSDGKKLSMNADRNSLPLNEVNDTWKVEKATTDGCFYLINANRPTYYVEWFAKYTEFTTYTYKASDESVYALQFIPVDQPLVADGKYVIYNPGSGKAMSANATGTYYRAGKDVTVTNGKVDNPSADLIWTVSSTDGIYTITTSDGKKLSMNADRNSLPLNEVNDTWKVEKATTDGCFYLINANRPTYYVEWFAKYTEFTTYTYKASDESVYALQFIPVDGSDQPSGGLPTVGDQVVIYNQNAQAVLAAQNDNATSPAINKAAATIQDGKAACANGAVVFEVQKNGDYYRFYNKTYGYLCAGGTGNNAFYSQPVSEDADWLVRTCSGGVGGYEMESRTAKYKGHSQWLEYYSDSFKVYSMYNVTDYTIYSFSFYPVGPGTISDGVVNNPAVVLGDLPYAYVGTDYSFTFTVDAPFGVRGDMTAKLNGTALTVTKGEDGTYTVTIPAASVTGDKLTVNINGTDNKHIPISAAAEITVKDEPVFSDPTPARGSQTGKNKRPAISVALANAGQNPTVTMSVGGKAVTPTYESGRVTYTPAADMTDGRTEVKVTANRADGKSAEFSWFFTVGKTTYQPYFGQLHSHTQYSDGSGTLDSALSYIRSLPDSANVQFVAFTDHSNYFDSKNDPNVEAALYDTTLVKDSDASHSWKTYKDTIAQFNEDNAGSMVAIGGFEMTWSGGPGHINTFNTPGIVSRNNKTLNNKTDDAGMKAYYALLSQTEGANSISQFNHPGTTFGNFKDFSYWNPVIDSRMYMVEVGNGEGQIGAGGYYPSYEQYIMALDKGWHLAPTNNQDNHQGKWGNANDARDVILTDNFTEEGIYDAIRALRMYATEDKNLELGYTVNGLMMGSRIETVPGKLDIEVSVYDPDRTDSIAKVEVVVNSGKVAHVWDDPAEFKSGTLSVTLAPEYSYYFIRVTQKDGDLAVTSPVWVGESLKLGISNLVCGTATPVTDEELTLTTTLFNSESAEATVTSLIYSIGGKVIGTDTAGYTIAAGSTLDIPFKWTPDQARVATVLVTAVVNQNNKDYTFTKTISLDVLDASKLVYIGIDASHYNEYVNGNYKDSMGNFGNLAAEYSVRTVQLNTSADLIAACSNPKYKAMVLTAPSRRSSEAQADPKTYSQEELAALTAFNDAGGTVILAGWSDNYENYDVIQNNPNTKHMAETQNDVLKALGSSLRISDDATYDDVRSAADGVDKWRLYFSDYNMDNFLTDGVIVDTNHPYDKMYTERFSHYGGASIYAVDADGNPASALPSTVSPVVYGHATTYSVDVDKDGRGGAGIPKYTYAENDPRLLIMATEQLEGKGMVIVSGAAFLSNFEVQSDLDNTLEKNYSNYRICENLINYLNPPKISTIAEVHADPDEGIKYTVEGIVTSNASGYDKNTAFFDCIYIQDETGGINCFPVAGDYQIGDKLRISGSTSSYQGERQLAVTKIRKLGADTPVEPKVVTAAQVNDGSVLGQLITLKGYVTGIEMANGLIQTILVRDAQGNVARVFIDGYITTSQDVANAAVGCEIEATGLASYDNTFVLEDGTPMAPRIRTRDRADIICTAHTHAFGEWTVTTPATCTKDGVKTRTCACGETETQTIPATGHSFGEWTVTTPATCTADGVETHSCACGETETRAIPATGHSFGEWTVTTPATCTVDGTETRTCSACGETETRTIPATGHTFGDWTVTTPATCTADGVETRSCACGETETRAIPATGHVDADNDGKCDVCQTVLTPVNPGDPDNPTPDNPDKPTPDTPDKPATGDSSAMVLWVSVMSITVLAGAALIRSKKRRA
ncbi:MAG: CehA/McbA family metallohydrolase [Oscillospiraceae bacterium]